MCFRSNPLQNSPHFVLIWNNFGRTAVLLSRQEWKRTFTDPKEFSKSFHFIWCVFRTLFGSLSPNTSLRDSNSSTGTVTRSSLCHAFFIFKFNRHDSPWRVTWTLLRYSYVIINLRDFSTSSWVVTWTLLRLFVIYIFAWCDSSSTVSRSLGKVVLTIALRDSSPRTVPWSSTHPNSACRWQFWSE